MSGSDSKEKQLWQACTQGNLSLVKSLSADAALHNINWKDPELERTPFYRSCSHGRASVVEFFLGECPQVDVNARETAGATPFNAACCFGHSDVVALLLAVESVDVNEPDVYNRTPLYMTGRNGQLGVAQFLLASGRTIDTKTKSMAGNDPWNNKTAAEMARWSGPQARWQSETEEDCQKRKDNCLLIAELIDAYERDPDGVCQELRRLPRIRDPHIGEVFGTVVFLSDDFLTLKAVRQPLTASEDRARRFFIIALALPMELQMVLCNRLFASGKDIVLGKHSEPAFRKLGKADTWESKILS
jgi:hypothetical protein